MISIFNGLSLLDKVCWGGIPSSAYLLGCYVGLDLLCQIYMVELIGLGVLGLVGQVCWGRFVETCLVASFAGFSYLGQDCWAGLAWSGLDWFGFSDYVCFIGFHSSGLQGRFVGLVSQGHLFIIGFYWSVFDRSVLLGQVGCYAWFYQGIDDRNIILWLSVWNNKR